MTHTQTTYINRITLRACKKEVRLAEVEALATVFENLLQSSNNKNYSNANKQ